MRLRSPRLDELDHRSHPQRHKNVAKDIDQVEQGFGHFSEEIANFKTSAKAFVSGMAA